MVGHQNSDMADFSEQGTFLVALGAAGCTPVAAERQVGPWLALLLPLVLGNLRGSRPWVPSYFVSFVELS